MPLETPLPAQIAVSYIFTTKATVGESVIITGEVIFGAALGLVNVLALELAMPEQAPILPSHGLLKE